jgi:uncharacterized protein YfdQ (DUF2303 family)
MMTTANPSGYTSTLLSTTGEAQAIVDTALAAAEPSSLEAGDVASIVVPAGATLQLLDLEDKLPNPRRKQGTARFFDAASIASYVNRHKDEATALYIDDDSYKVVAVLNGHAEDSPGWGDHRAELYVRRTDAWKRWRDHDDQLIDQESFAEHIERNLIDIVEPAGAHLLELAQTFQATSKAEFRSAKQLANGERQFQFNEEISASGGRNGEITIPKEFVLGIAPFEGVDPYKLRARLRYRLREGRLTIGYVLDNPKDIERTAFVDMAQEVSGSTDLTSLLGIPAVTHAAQ